MDFSPLPEQDVAIITCVSTDRDRIFKVRVITIFNGQVCVDPSQYTCPESIQKADCQGKSDGVYPNKQSGWRNYFMYLGEVQTNLSCPAGQLFDGRRCADSRRVTCNDPAVIEGLTNSMQSPCAGKTNGLYLDQSFPGCRGYLYCSCFPP